MVSQCVLLHNSWGIILAVTPETLLLLSNIVEEKKWGVFDGLFRKGKNIYDSLLEMFDDLDELESGILMKLIKEYLIVAEYRKPSYDLLDSLVAEGVKEAAFCPIRNFSHAKTKSGQNLLYEIDGIFSQYGGCHFTSFDNPARDDFVYDPRQKILVDDFIGTGDQLDEFLLEMEAIDPMLKFSRILVVAIQSEACKYIQGELGIPVHYLYERDKAIAVICAKYGGAPEEAHEIYDRIEARTGAAHGVRRGYQQSEALVTLKRTPDNTLPIFWENGGGKWPAPFPR